MGKTYYDDADDEGRRRENEFLSTFKSNHQNVKRQVMKSNLPVEITIRGQSKVNQP